ncbi:hypothetical protein JW826_02325 [Candidatus Woesearchaeota archaeon]|nr:hypothetical protein [Candidatus Woesearchaeota archaeon]
MKHDFKVTLFLIGLFLAAQMVGLVLLRVSLVESVDDQGNRVVSFDESKVGEVPEMSGLGFLLYVVIGISVGTALVLLLVRFRKANWWRAWFFLAVFVAINFALKTFLSPPVAFVLAFVLAVWKIYKPNVVVHNLTEVFMYAGIAVFLVPLLNSMQNESFIGIPGNIFWASLLLVLISVYDFIAVFKSKHMVSMAEFQTESKVFAGLLVQYKVKKDAVVDKVKGVVSRSISRSVSKNARKADIKAAPRLSKTDRKDLELPRIDLDERKTAILGGGDIAFPLIFIGTVMFHLANVVSISQAFLESAIIVATTTVALALLFIFAKKDKFYPAMPFISAGCFAGYFLVLLI